MLTESRCFTRTDCHDFKLGSMCSVSPTPTPKGYLQQLLESPAHPSAAMLPLSLTHTQIKRKIVTNKRSARQNEGCHVLSRGTKVYE